MTEEADKRATTPNQKDIKSSLTAIISTVGLIEKCLEAANITVEENNKDFVYSVGWGTNSKH